MKRIAVIGAGGTIAMQGAHRFDWVDYGDTGIVNRVDKLIAAMDFGLATVEVMPVHFRTLGSTGISVADWLELNATVTALAQGTDVDGIVVTHGTATLEDTAFFLSLIYRGDKPVVICGAQRPPNTDGSDVVTSVRSALTAAAQAASGTYVAMNGYLYDPATVSKTANFALDAFEDPEFGPLGRIDADGTLAMRRSVRRNVSALAPALRARTDLPRVDIVYSYAGADGVQIDACVRAGARAIISAGFPPGRCTPQERNALIRAVDAGVLVVQSSRALRGAVPVQPYNRDKGILAGGNLAPNKIRIAVMLALTLELSPKEIEDFLVGF